MAARSPVLEPSERYTSLRSSAYSAEILPNFAFTGAMGLLTRTVTAVTISKRSIMANAHSRASFSMRSNLFERAICVMRAHTSE